MIHLNILLYHIYIFFPPSKEEDEKERLSQVKELLDEDGGDNTEPLEDFLGPSIEEV